MDILINTEVPLTIKLRYNTNVYDSGFMRKLVCHIEEVVDQVIENDNKKIEDILVSHDRLEVKSSISLDDESDFEL